MRKKRIIILCSILSVFAVLIILASTVFRLSKVQVNFLTTNMTVLSETDAKTIKDTGKFKTGGNILFMNFEKQKANIEKNVPYAKVVKIERKFPNKAVVHISERTPAAIINDGIVAYVLDSDLKVLKVVDIGSFDQNHLTSAEYNSPTLNGIEIEKTLTSGDFVNNTTAIGVVSCIESGLKSISYSIQDLSNINVSQENDQTRLTLHVRGNSLYLELDNISSLKSQIQEGFTFYFAHLKQDGRQNGKITKVGTEWHFVAE